MDLITHTSSTTNSHSYSNIILAIILFSGTSVTQNPDYACEGESITVSCVLTVPNDGYTFTATEISFNINGLENAIFGCRNIGICSYKGVDLNRFQPYIPIGSLKSVNGYISFAYNSSDEGIPIGCMVDMREIEPDVSEILIITHRVVGAGMCKLITFPTFIIISFLM